MRTGNGASRDGGACGRREAAGRAIVACALLLILLPSRGPAQIRPAVPDTVVDRAREAAVLLAREGWLAEARDRLLELRTRHPEDARVLADLLVVLGWLGAWDAVRAHASDALPGALPAYAAEVVARADRAGRDPAAAAARYAAVLAREPDRRDSRIGLALSLLDGGQPREGVEVLRPLLGPGPVDREVTVAAGHLHLAAGDPLEAAAWYQRALDVAPGDEDAYRGRALALALLGAAHLAAEQVRARPELFPESERQQVEGDVAAMRVRWIDLPRVASTADGRADVAARDPYQTIDAVLQSFDERLASVPRALRFHYNRARFDRLVALNARGLAEGVVAEIERLERQGVDLPPYVLRIAGDAHLQLRRPRRAADYLRRDLEARPGHVETRIGLFHALLEVGDHTGALAQIDSLVAEQPEWRWAPGLREPRENPDRVRADVAAHMARAFTGRLAAAERGLRAMADGAPANPLVRAELASVLRFRGRPSRALEQAELGLALDSAYLALRIARVAALIDLRDWRRAAPEIGALRTTYTASTHVRRLARAYDRERGWAFHADAERGGGTGTAAVATRDTRVEAMLLSPSTDGGLRGFVRALHTDAVFGAGDARYERFEAGLRLDRPRGWLAAGAGTDRDGAAPGGTIELGLRHGDGFDTRLRVESHASLVPLQARITGVDGWGATLGLRRAWHEGRTARVELARADLDDGNTRLSGRAALEQRVATAPRLRLNALFEVYGSHNTRADAPYFNPRADVAPAAGLTAEWHTWRRYERAFTQHVTLSGGGYWQDGYGIEPTLVARYQHLWSLSDGVAVRYGVTAWSRTFDGVREGRASVTAGLDWRVR